MNPFKLIKLSYTCLIISNQASSCPAFGPSHWPSVIVVFGFWGWMEKVPVIDLVFFAAGFELLLLPYDPPPSVCCLVSWPVCWLVCRSYGRRSVIIFWKGGKLHFNALEFRSTCLLTEKLTKPFYFCRRIDEASQMPETTQEDSSFKRKLSKREKKALKKQVNI